MATVSVPEELTISPTDLAELSKLVNAVALSDRALTLFAIAPESAPDHPVVRQFAEDLKALDESLQFSTFFYSDDSLFNFLAGSNAPLDSSGRRVIFAFGLEQLPTPRRKQELEQLNLAREKLFERNIVVVFWLNRESFLGEFRSRAPDFWDWRGKVAVFETRHPLLYPYLEWLISTNSYLTMNGIMQVNRQVDIFLDQIYVSLQAERKQPVRVTHLNGHGVIASKASQLQGAAIGDRIDPYHDSERGLNLETLHESTPGSKALETELGLEAISDRTAVERIDLSAVVRGTYPCSVILGAPGAGKTTLLKYLALHFAKAQRDGQAIVLSGIGENLGPTRLPIFFKIADYAEHLEKTSDLSLLDYLKQFYRQWEDYFENEADTGFGVVSLLLEQMRAGNCLILLDGLDEVFDQESRRKIVERINDFAEQFSHNKLIVTSRIAGYQDIKLISRFTEFTIAEMSSEQASDFLHRWCRAVEKAQKPDATEEQCLFEGARQAELILTDIYKNEGVKRLTTNPLLLTILALIHRNGERLPERRVKLYELAVQTLTADWQLSKKLPNTQRALLQEGEVVEMLAPLAYWMHEEKPSGLVTHAEVVQRLSPRLAEMRGETVDSSTTLELAEDFLRRVRETTGLFVERSPGVYGFMHLTFEEYFAARYIVDREIKKACKLVRSKMSDPRWEETILLAIGYLNDRSPGLSRTLTEDLFKDLIGLGNRMLPKRRLRFLSSAKLFLATIETKIDRRKSNKLLKKTFRFFFSIPLFFFDEVIILSSNYWMFRYAWSAYFNTHYLEKLNLALHAAQDASINTQVRLKLFQGLVANRLLINALSNAISFKIPHRFIKPLKRIFRRFFKREQALEKFNFAITEEIKNTEASDVVDHLLTYIREISNNFSLPGIVIYESLELFCEVSVDYTLSREESCNSPADILESLRFGLPGKHQAIAYWYAGLAYRARGKYEKALEHHQRSCHIYQTLDRKANVANQWYWIAACYCDWGKYEQAIETARQSLAIREELSAKSKIAFSYYQLGHIYWKWNKYERAIAHYKQSLDRFQQIRKESDVANQWYWIAACYQEWGKYEQAISAGKNDLEIRERLDDQLRVSFAYSHFGYIYQTWGKYTNAIIHHKQSLDRFQRLGKETNVAGQWYWIAACYRAWGKYEQAIEAEQQDLAIREKLDDQRSIADAYYQFGRIYQAWEKYEEALAYHEQSRERYQQLGKETSVADQWYWIADCYREWGKYEQAIEAEQQDLEIREQLDDQSNIADAYYQFGRIYQAWGKYEEAIAQYEQSRERYQHLGKETTVADLWYNLSTCYRDWGKYEQAIEAEQQDLEIREQLDDQSNIADAYYQFGRIYRAWGKYEEAITHHQRSKALYHKLDLKQEVANQLSHIAACYRDLKQYTAAIEHYQDSIGQHKALEQNESVARRLRQLANTQRLQAKESSQNDAERLLQKADNNLQQAIQLNTTKDYLENLAYDYVAFALITAEQLRWLPHNDPSVLVLTNQFEQSATAGFTRFTELGDAVNSAEGSLDIARAYLEISPLKDLDKAEEFAHQALQTFQDFNRQKLQAAAYKLLGEIYLARAHREDPGAISTANEFLTNSLNIYRALDISSKAIEVEQLLISKISI